MRNPLLAKLRARRGATLSELLVSVIVLGLVTAAVATGIAAGSRTYEMSTTLSRSQLLASTLSQAVSDELRYGRSIEPQPDGTVRYTSDVYGEGAQMRVEDGRIVIVSDAQLIPGKLVGDGTYGEYEADLDVEFDADADCFQVRLRINRGETEAQSIQFAVRALNPPKP